MCGHCRAVKYPPAEVCANCLGESLDWGSVENTGTLLATTPVMATSDDFFRMHLPLSIGSVKLDCGPVVIVFIPKDDIGSGASITIATAIDHSGHPVLVAHNQMVGLDSEAFDWNGSALRSLLSVPTGD